MSVEITRGRMPAGAELLSAGGVRFRVWAPRRRDVEVVLEGGPGARTTTARRPSPSEPDGDGYFEGVIGSAGPGTLYRYRLDGEGTFPDPASRFQPEGPHGPSQVVDPDAFAWTDAEWRGLRLAGPGALRDARRHLHPRGDMGGRRRRLPDLKELGDHVPSR